jgi:hypothetical protein
MRLADIRGEATHAAGSGTASANGPLGVDVGDRFVHLSRFGEIAAA